MLALSDHLGRDVVASDGRRVGAVRDLGADLAGEYPRVATLVVGRGRAGEAWVPFNDVATFERASVDLAIPASALPSAGDQDLLLLRRDVLDVQIIDVAGRRVVRVADVDLVREGRDLIVAGVEVGLGAVLRRLGLRRLSGRARRDAVDWRDLHLTSARGHALQLRAGTVRRMGPGDLAQLVGRLPVERAAQVLQSVGPGPAAAALAASRPRVGGQLVGGLDPAHAARVVGEMAADDAAAALRHVPEEPLEGLLGRLTAARAEELRRLLAYPPKTVGGLMTPDVRTCLPSDGLDDIRAALALHPPRLEGLLTVFEVDQRGRLRGAITPVALIAGRREPVEVPALRADAPVDEALEAFALNDLLAVPVVDEDGTLLGAVAVDDVIEELLVERLPGRRRYSFPTRAPT